MKSIIGLLFFILFSLTHIFGSDNQIKIEGQILGYKGKKEVNYSISPFLAENLMNKTVKPDSLGRFTITSSIDKVHFFWMYFSQNNVAHRCQLILKPGCNYSFVSKGCVMGIDTYYTPIITGCNYEGQMNFNLIDNGNRGNVFYNNWSLNYPENLIDTLHKRIERKISIFQNLLENEQIDLALFDIATLNIKFFTAYQLAYTILRIVNKNNQNEVTKTEELKRVNAEIFKNYPIKDQKIENTLIFEDYIWLYLAYLEEVNVDEFEEYKEKGLTMTYALNNAKNVLSDKAYQFFAIKSILNYSTKLDKEAQLLFENFKREYPSSLVKNSHYYKLLEYKYIPEIVELHKLSNKALPLGITILDIENPITSFQALVTHLKGKPFFIDCWATWCSPCRYDFQYNSPLKTFLKENKIEMVYISFDKSTEREKWSNYIKSFALKGYHLMSNNALKSDLQQVFEDVGFGLPRYIIVSSNGEIVERDAYRPSDEEKLYKQIKKKLKL